MKNKKKKNGARVFVEKINSLYSLLMEKIRGESASAEDREERTQDQGFRRRVRLPRMDSFTELNPWNIYLYREFVTLAISIWSDGKPFDMGKTCEEFPDGRKGNALFSVTFMCVDGTQLEISFQKRQGSLSLADYRFWNFIKSKVSKINVDLYRPSHKVDFKIEKDFISRCEWLSPKAGTQLFDNMPLSLSERGFDGEILRSFNTYGDFLVKVADSLNEDEVESYSAVNYYREDYVKRVSLLKDLASLYKLSIGRVDHFDFNFAKLAEGMRENLEGGDKSKDCDIFGAGGVSIFVDGMGDNNAVEKKRYSNLINNLSVQAPEKERVLSLYDLVEKFPNFKEALAAIQEDCMAADFRSGDFRLEPLALFGYPGLGKSYFARKVCDHLGLVHDAIQATSISGKISLMGNSPRWADADAGILLNSINRLKCKNPVFIFDEIEKMEKAFRSSGNIESCFLELLESSTSNSVYSEYFDSKWDASGVSYVFTGNDISELSIPIKSRLSNTIMVKRAVGADSVKVTESILENVAKEYSLGVGEVEISRKIILDLSELVPRESHKRIQKAFKKAVRRAYVGNLSLEICDLDFMHN